MPKRAEARRTRPTKNCDAASDLRDLLRATLSFLSSRSASARAISFGFFFGKPQSTLAHDLVVASTVGLLNNSDKSSLVHSSAFSTYVISRKGAFYPRTLGALVEECDAYRNEETLLFLSIGSIFPETVEYSTVLLYRCVGLMFSHMIFRW